MSQAESRFPELPPEVGPEVDMAVSGSPGFGGQLSGSEEVDVVRVVSCVRLMHIRGDHEDEPSGTQDTADLLQDEALFFQRYVFEDVVGERRAERIVAEGERQAEVRPDD